MYTGLRSNEERISRLTQKMAILWHLTDINLSLPFAVTGVSSGTLNTPSDGAKWQYLLLNVGTCL
jgi:hypothetical protein